MSAWRHLSCLAFSVVLLNAQGPHQTIPDDIAKDTYEVYSSILKSELHPKEAIVMEATGLTATQMGDAEPASDEERGMFENFRRLSDAEYLWEPRFNLGRPYTFIRQDEMKKRFRGCRPDPDGARSELKSGARCSSLLRDLIRRTRARWFGSNMFAEGCAAADR